MLKFYPQILSTEASLYSYDRQRTEINVMSFCALKLRIKLWYLLHLLKQRLLQRRETEVSFCFYTSSETAVNNLVGLRLER